MTEPGQNTRRVSGVKTTGVKIRRVTRMKTILKETVPQKRSRVERIDYIYIQ